MSDLNKIKIVWFCITDLKEFNNIFYFNRNITTTVPWIMLLLEEFKKHTASVELHVISSFSFLKKDYHFRSENIEYHFLNHGLPFTNKSVPFSFLPKIRLFAIWVLSRRVKKLVKHINPDLIHLHGTEFELAYSILGLKDYPRFVTIQGFMTQVYDHSPSPMHKQGYYIEKKIFKECQHFGIRAKFMNSVIDRFNKNAKYYWHNYPIENINLGDDRNTSINSELIFAARIVKDKGIEDLIKCLSIVKREFPEIKLKIVGRCTKGYQKYLLALVNELDLVDNIIWVGFLPTHKQVLHEIKASRICVLPTYYDIIPGTILESMFLKIPVVAYSVGGIPDLNENCESLLLVPKGDINGLAEKITKLMHDSKLRHQLANKAFAEVKKRYDNAKVFYQVYDAYLSIIREYRNYCS